MDGVCVVDEVVPPPEGLVAELALEALPAVHRLDVRVEAPLAHQSPAAGACAVGIDIQSQPVVSIQSIVMPSVMTSCQGYQKISAVVR